MPHKNPKRWLDVIIPDFILYIGIDFFLFIKRNCVSKKQGISKLFCEFIGAKIENMKVLSKTVSKKELVGIIEENRLCIFPEIGVRTAIYCLSESRAVLKSEPFLSQFFSYILPFPVLGGMSFMSLVNKNKIFTPKARYIDCYSLSFFVLSELKFINIYYLTRLFSSSSLKKYPRDSP